jgi:hypothetical protein
MAFAALSGVLASWAINPHPHEPGPRRTHWLAAAAVSLSLVALLPVASSTWLTSLDTLHGQEQSRGEMQQLVERVRDTPDDVLADPLDVLVLADRHPLFEPLLLQIFFEDGRWDVRPLVRQVCDGRFGLAVVDRPISSLVWPAPLREAVEDAMQLEGTQAGRMVYVPRAPSPGGICARGAP